MCLFSKLGLSKALPQTSQGSRALSPRVGRDFGEDRWWTMGIGVSKRSPELLAFELTDNESPETDLCSSSLPLVGEMGNRTLDMSDVDRSRGESGIEKEMCLLIIQEMPSIIKIWKAIKLDTDRSNRLMNCIQMKIWWIFSTFLVVQLLRDARVDISGRKNGTRPNRNTGVNYEHSQSVLKSHYRSRIIYWTGFCECHRMNLSFRLYSLGVIKTHYSHNSLRRFFLLTHNPSICPCNAFLSSNASTT